ncbi:hypothetical protein PsorP6_015217 [Peronosclerospora sorghi]|uniref:Uncharacterized protein n=1 Tax=Peronosclerospora sorghi TaxID=230839 RepID=A0ACC0VSW5_9STRA|nr:hypothetical protein PsorP6_015217 [Peronosclerospora sorghi]
MLRSAARFEVCIFFCYALHLLKNFGRIGGSNLVLRSRRRHSSLIANRKMSSTSGDRVEDVPSACEECHGNDRPLILEKTAFNFKRDR